MAIFRDLCRLATGTGSDEKPYDEEGLLAARDPTARRQRPDKPKAGSRRVSKKTAVWLVVIDIVLLAAVVLAFEPLITLLRRNEELFVPRRNFEPDSVSGPAPRPAQNRIPRILHQTAATDVIPAKWALSQQSCIEQYADFEYKLWTDAVARDFIATEYPWFLDTWDGYPFVIQRADSIRYFVLHHYGGIYLDMDTLCNKTFPLDQVESESATHQAIFKSTLPTGVTNDFMIATARHPVFATAIARLPAFHALTRIWAQFQPYCAIMISSGPFFLTLAVKNYLLELPSLPSATVQVVTQAQLTPYITDLESCTWHQGDAKALMWVGDRPWVWFMIGAVGVVIGLYIINSLLLLAWKAGLRRVRSVSYDLKLAKLT